MNSTALLLLKCHIANFHVTSFSKIESYQIHVNHTENVDLSNVRVSNKTNNLDLNNV